MMKSWKQRIGLLLAACMNAFALTAEAFQPPAAAMLPGMNPITEPVSAARWLWFQAPEVKGQTSAYYRMKIVLDEPVASAWILCALDDSGEVYCNGVKLPEVAYSQPDCPIRCRRFEPKNWQTGENVLTWDVHNGEAMGGMIMRGEIRLASGKVMELYSDKSHIQASPKQENGWRMPGFSGVWQEAMELGDVLIEPWKSVSAVPTLLLTEKERAAYEKKLDSFADVSFLQNEPQRQAKVVWHNDMAALEVNGKAEAPVIYLVGGNPWIPQVADSVVKAAQSGIRFQEFQFSSSKFFLAPGKYDFSAIDRDVRRVLALAPDTNLFLAFRFDLLGQWAKDHPDEAIGYATGAADGWGGQVGRYPSPSVAGEAFRAEMRAFAKAAAEYIASRDWYKRVVAVRVSHGVYSEWHYYGMSESMPDTGKAMTKAFRKFLRQKYADDAALQAAWHDPAVTLDAATVPNAAERWGQKRFFRDPASADRKTLDYYECHSNVVADTLIEFASTFKKYAPKVLLGAYYGYFFCMGYPAEGQTLMMEKVLSNPAIDFLSSPYSYDMASREVGGDGLPRMVMSTFKRYGKLPIMEADVRTHLTPRHEPYIAAATPAESLAVIRRDFANAWMNGSAIQFLEFDARRGKNSWFNAPEIYQAWHEGIEVWHRLYQRAAKADEANDAAVVVSTAEMTRHGYPEEKYQRPIVETILDKTLHALYASGVKFDLLELHDFLAAKHNYKMVVFLNVFSPSDAQRKVLKNKVRRPGVTALWSYAPGLVTENGFSDLAMQELTGMELAAQHERLPLAVSLPGCAPMVSVGRRLGALQENPRVAVTDKKAEIIGKYHKDGVPAIAAKKLADGSQVIFTGMPVIEPSLWRALFRRGGISAYAQGDAMVRGTRSLLLVHTARGGAYEIQLPPGVKKVTELFANRPVKLHNHTIILRSAVADSWFFLTE